MPLPNGLPEWVFPGTLLRRIEDESLWTIVQVALFTGVNVLSVAVEPVQSTRLSAALTYPVETLLDLFMPANNERAHHLVPVEGARGQLYHPVWLETVQFRIDLVTDEFVTLAYDLGSVIDSRPPVESLPREVYRANVLWQEMPAVLTGQQVDDAGVPWEVTRVILGEDNPVHLRSPRFPHNEIVSDLEHVTQMQNAGHSPGTSVPYYALIIDPTDERRAFGFVTRDDGESLDVNFVGSTHVERVPRERIFFSVLDQISRFTISPDNFRQFRIGDLFHVRGADVFLGVIAVEQMFASLQNEQGQAVSLNAPTHEVTFVHEGLPLGFEYNPQNVEFAGNTSQVSFGFPSPPLEGDLSGPYTPLTRIPLTGFRLTPNDRPPTPTTPINRRSSFERLLDDEDS